MFLIDSHVHFDDVQFDADRAAALQRAQSVGVRAQILPAVTANSWAQLKQVCQHYPNLFPAYGLHPIYLAAHQTSHLSLLDAWLQHEPAVAVGECGLDFYLKELNPTQQTQYFMAQLRLAQQHQLPVIIHARRSVDAVLKCLRQVRDLTGVVHSFVGSEQQAQQLIDLGFYLSFGGAITYPRAQRLHRLVASLPLERLLLETDAPDQPLCGRQGQRNEPAYLTEVLQHVAQLRQQTAADIAAATSRNTMTLFNLPLKLLDGIN